jgi:hypothetical protein
VRRQQSRRSQTAYRGSRLPCRIFRARPLPRPGRPRADGGRSDYRRPPMTTLVLLPLSGVPFLRESGNSSPGGLVRPGNSCGDSPLGPGENRPASALGPIPDPWRVSRRCRRIEDGRRPNNCRLSFPNAQAGAGRGSSRSDFLRQPSGGGVVRHGVWVVGGGRGWTTVAARSEPAMGLLGGAAGSW